MTIGTPRLCIVLVNTRGVQSDEVKDKVFHALVNPQIPLSDRQENQGISANISASKRIASSKPRNKVPVYMSTYTVVVIQRTAAFLATSCLVS